MVAQSLFDCLESPAQHTPTLLRIAPLDPFDGRISNPHVRSDVEDCYESMRDEHREPVPELTPAELDEARRDWSLSRIYWTYLEPWRLQRRDEGKIAGGTLSKERQSIRCFEKWDQSPDRTPEKWPRGIAWRGLPAGFLATKYFERWIRSRLEAGYSDGTMKPRWNHVRTVLNMARRMGIIDETPKIDLDAVVKAYQNSIGDPDDDLVPQTYTDPQLDLIYGGVHEPDMRCALVLGTNCGARTVDLFSMRWGRDIRLGDRPEVYYKARKTGRRHWVPLHPVTVLHLRRLIALQGHLNPNAPEGLLFPRLTSGKSKNPEKGRPARRRNTRIKAVMASVGINLGDGDFDKPWQVLRSTCSSRLNNHRPGAGRLVTHGKDADVNSQHYWDHFPTLVEAIATLRMPAAFSNL